MRHNEINPLHLRDFIILAVLTAAVALLFLGVASTISNTRQSFEVLPAVSKPA